VSAATLTLALIGGGPWAAAASAAGGRTIETSAVADAASPGVRLATSSLDLVFVPGGRSVHATNVAVAHSTCDGCRSVAASVQVVVVRGANTGVDAGNAALAFNEGCTSCESLADAHQVVLLAGPKAGLAPWVHVTEVRLREALAELVTSDLPLDELRDRIDSIAAQLQDAAQAALTERGTARATSQAHIARRRHEVPAAPVDPDTAPVPVAPPLP
jgi:hypothetical protein